MIKDATCAQDCSKLINVSFTWSQMCKLNLPDDIKHWRASINVFKVQVESQT